MQVSFMSPQEKEVFEIAVKELVRKVTEPVEKLLRRPFDARRRKKLCKEAMRALLDLSNLDLRSVDAKIEALLAIGPVDHPEITAVQSVRRRVVERKQGKITLRPYTGPSVHADRAVLHKKKKRSKPPKTASKKRLKTPPSRHKQTRRRLPQRRSLGVPLRAGSQFTIPPIPARGDFGLHLLSKGGLRTLKSR